jgi:hypothetical protein
MHHLRAPYTPLPPLPPRSASTIDRTPRDFACDQALHAPKLEGVVGKVVPTNMNKSPKPLEQDFVYGAASRPGVYALQCTPPSMGEDRRSWQAYHAPY